VVWALTDHHDRSEFEIHLFCDGSDPTPGSGYVKDERDLVHDLTDVTNEEAAERIRRAEIDILVDLNGYSSTQRFGMFMLRPVQKLVSCFGMYA